MNYIFGEFKKEHLNTAALIENYTLDGWSKEQICEELESQAAYMFAATCKENDELVAFCAFQCAANEANLNAITCMPGHRKKGVAKMLLKYAFEHLPAQNVYLEVRAQNVPAIGLYKSLGFNEAGLRKNFYQAPKDDAIVMSLEINKEKTC